MAENILPEEKLFKIIQQEKKSSLKGKGEDPELKKKKDGWYDGFIRKLLAWKEALIAQTGKIAGLVAGKVKLPVKWKIHDIQLFTINSILFIMVIVLVFFTIYYAFASYPNLARIVTATAKAQSYLPSVNKEAEELHPINYYTQAARQRDIFRVVQPGPAAGDTSLTAGEKTLGGELKLQGIAWSDAPKVMIFSEKDNKLYVVKEGQAIGTTGTRVKTILRNKVILNSGDKNFEL
ncbi:MAG: hypothetical protein PHX20_04660 [Candidatus Omnitrophica bacterium]|nr:hypothetical protein [Candidatus Omnitrophota bacterium]